ncbi:hypothetical protein [Defluviimonas sp. WL0075]|uniref:Uncharacterized protein n=1 Tax=Albidovulum sediminicola TaxID=2984331 RepID=A0ABT2Z0X5_9RHOB|nr:hypothetical protein [Defluviimonas sp. WL0075]MCV2864776.1 hypothetical protein [Defluviimonas sp. WL0075]
MGAHDARALSEPLDKRLMRVESDLLGVTGARARLETVKAFLPHAREVPHPG